MKKSDYLSAISLAFTGLFIVIVLRSIVFPDPETAYLVLSFLQFTLFASLLYGIKADIERLRDKLD